MILVYLLKLKNEKKVSDAMAYLAEADPLFARNGIVKVAYYRTKSKIRAQIGVDADIVQISKISGQSSFDRLADDKDYAKMIPRRDTIFDMDRCIGWFADDLLQ